MTRTALDSGILRFCSHLLADLGLPEVKTEVISMKPLKLHIGVLIPDVPPETVLSAITTEGIHAACQEAWPPSPNGFSVNFPLKSLGLAADDKHVIFDMVFYSATLEPEEHLKPKA